MVRSWPSTSPPLSNSTDMALATARRRTFAATVRNMSNRYSATPTEKRAGRTRLDDHKYVQPDRADRKNAEEGGRCTEGEIQAQGNAQHEEHAQIVRVVVHDVAEATADADRDESVDVEGVDDRRSESC